MHKKDKHHIRTTVIELEILMFSILAMFLLYTRSMQPHNLLARKSFLTSSGKEPSNKWVNVTPNLTITHNDASIYSINLNFNQSMFISI